MSRQDDMHGAPGEGRPTGIGRAWAWLVDGLGALGTVLIGALMLLICADVVARNVFGGSLPLVSELGALVVVMIVYLQLATTVRADRLARTEIFIAPLRAARPRLAAGLELVFALAGAALLGAIARATLHILDKDLEAGEYIGVTGIATMPTWPFRVLILVGVTVAALQCLLRAWAALRVMTGRGEAPA